MKSLKQIQTEISKLQREADIARKREIAGVVAEIKIKMKQFGIVATDLQGNLTKNSAKVQIEKIKKPRKSCDSSKLKGRKVEAKYRHPDTTQTWTGRGRQPTWVTDLLTSGRTLDQLKIS
jgi:DNA-binding protein H-NS